MIYADSYILWIIVWFCKMNKDFYANASSC